MPDVVAVEFDDALAGGVKTHEEFGKRAFAGTGGTHDGGDGSGGDVHLEALVEKREVVGVAEGEVFNVDLAFTFSGTLRGDGVGFGGGVHDVAKSLDGEVGLLELLPEADES